MEKAVKSQIREAIRTRDTESRGIRQAIHASKGMDRWWEWQTKRTFGSETRHLLLAYAFLRGMPYMVAEKKCGEFNRPSPSYIREFAVRYDDSVTKEAVQGWLSGAQVPVSQETVAAE